MNYARKKPKFCRGIVSVVPDVFFGDLGIRGQKSFHASRLGEDVRSMAQLRCLHDNGPLQIENVFVPEQVNAACAA